MNKFKIKNYSIDLEILVVNKLRFVKTVMKREKKHLIQFCILRYSYTENICIKLSNDNNRS